MNSLNRNQISIFTSYSERFEKVAEFEGITLKLISVIGKYAIYEYADAKDRREQILYLIKGVYEDVKYCFDEEK